MEVSLARHVSGASGALDIKLQL